MLELHSCISLVASPLLRLLQRRIVRW